MSTVIGITRDRVTHMTVTRGTTNRNDRGNSASRRVLKCWMLAKFGDGISAPCAFCGRQLLPSQVTKDRFPIPGCKGGKYVKGNVRPACLSCNASEGARQAAIERTEAKLKHEARLARRRELYAIKGGRGAQRRSAGLGPSDAA